MTAGLAYVNPVGIVHGALNHVYKSGRSLGLSSQSQAMGHSYGVNMFGQFLCAFVSQRLMRFESLSLLFITYNYFKVEVSMSLFDVVKKALLAGLGAQEKVKELVDELVKKGEISKSQGAKIVKTWTEKADKRKENLSKNLSELINKTLTRMNIPTKKDIQELNKKIDALSKKLEGTEKKEQ